jgi:hypothetical protein
MNNEEPDVSAQQNITVSPPSEVVPEQTAQKDVGLMPSISMTSLIYQWQPMGIRVNMKLPFIGDDSGIIFAIRNGPFIPDVIDDLSEPLYAWNNTRNVYVLPNQYESQIVKYPKDKEGNFSITMTAYDSPPILSTIAASFRRWRGDMQYRLRVVAGFATQGYLICAPLKNSHIPIGLYDEYSETPTPTRQDSSYREMMMNAYVMSDTSMFRHIEVTVPYEYPVPYYDQYQWLSNRISPVLKKTPEETELQNVVLVEPHGDNFVCMMVRGELRTTEDTGNLTFELEYRASEGFQFADPGLPPRGFTLPQTYKLAVNDWSKAKTIPSSAYKSDGLATVTKTNTRGTIASVLDAIMPVVKPPPESARPPVNEEHPSFTEREHDVTTTTTRRPQTFQNGAIRLTANSPYSECRYDSRTDHTYCKDKNTGVWKTFKGNHGHALSAHRSRRDVEDFQDENPPSTQTPSQLRRDAEFSY